MTTTCTTVLALLLDFMVTPLTSCFFSNDNMDLPECSSDLLKAATGVSLKSQWYCRGNTQLWLVEGQEQISEAGWGTTITSFNSLQLWWPVQPWYANRYYTQEDPYCQLLYNWCDYYVLTKGVTGSTIAGLTNKLLPSVPLETNLFLTFYCSHGDDHIATCLVDQLSDPPNTLPPSNANLHLYILLAV